MPNRIPSGPPRWIAWVVVATLVATLAGGAWLYHEQEHALRVRAEAELEAIAVLKSGEISRWREERLADARRLVSAPGARGLMIDWLAEPTAENLEPVVQTLESLRHGDRYADVLLMNTEGKTLVSASGDVIELQPKALDSLEAALASGEPVFTDLQRDVLKGAPHLDVIAPILSSDQPDAQPIAVVVFRIDAEQFLFPLIQTWPIYSDTAETLLVERDGEDALFLNDVRHASDAALDLREPLESTDSVAVKAVLGERDIVEGSDYRGHTVIAYVSAIPNTPWLMISKVDTSEAFAAWQVRSRYIVALMAVLAAAVLGTPAFVVQRMRAAQIAQDNARLEELVAERTADLHHTAEKLAITNERLEMTVEELQSTNEELQTTSEELLATTEELQAMNEQLQLTSDELALANSELVAASEAKSRFLRAMSHELRTPLNSIIGFSGLMVKGLAGDVTDEQRHQLELINQSGQHLLALVNDVLDLARIEADRADLTIREFDLRRRVAELVESVRPEAEARGLDLVFEVADDLPATMPYSSDDRRIGQVLLNLLGNAVKFTGTGRITTRLFRRSPNTIGISVTDSGPGIPREDRERIFSEFVQGANAFDSGQRGAGLGLAISRSLAQLLGGTLTLESPGDGGSTFTLLLPETPDLPGSNDGYSAT